VKGPARSTLSAQLRGRAIRGGTWRGAPTCVYSVDLGNDIAAEDGPTNARERLSFGLQRGRSLGAGTFGIGY